MKTKVQLERLFLYEYLYERIYCFNHCKLGEVGVKETKKNVAHAHNIPYNFWEAILKQMEELGWIEKVNRDNIRLIAMPGNLIENPAQAFKFVGVF